MKNFKSIEEFNDYVKYLIEIDTDNNVNELKQFLRISPERIARKFNLDIISLVKKTNISKKKILKITTIVAINKKIMYNDGVRSYNI